MRISNQFTLAVRILVYIDTFKEDYKVTSDFLARSTKVKPATIRKILGQLKTAGLIAGGRRAGSGFIRYSLDEISLLDVYRAVECIPNGQMFYFRENKNTDYPVGKERQIVLDEILSEVQENIEKELCSKTLADVVDIAKHI